MANINVGDGVKLAKQGEALAGIFIEEIMNATKGNPFGVSESFMVAQAIANLYGWYASIVDTTISPELAKTFEQYCKTSKQDYDIRNKKIISNQKDI